MKSIEAIARTAYQEFCHALQNSGVVLPPWHELPARTHAAWEAAARSVAADVQNIH